MKKLLPILVLFSAVAASAGTFTAASCNYSDVNAVVNGGIHTAVDGDVIVIPSGSCTWSGGVTLTVPSNIGITIRGAGTPNGGASTSGAASSCTGTVITDGQSSNALFSFAPQFGNSTTRLSCLELLPPSSGAATPIQVLGTCTSSGCPNLRLDNITASGWGAITVTSDQTLATVVGMYGVADHNTITDTTSVGNYTDLINVAHPSWLGVGSFGDNSWATADNFGTASQFYLELNVFNNTGLTDTDTTIGTGGGGRWTCRFNTVNGINPVDACSDHGTDTTGRARGGRQWEVYGNTGTCTNSSQGCNTFAPGRAGVGIMFGNTFTNSGGGFFKSISTIDAQRRWRPDAPWGSCDGTSVWDVNGGSNPLYSGTISSVTTSGSTYIISVSGTPWTVNQWAANGAPDSFVDVTQGFGYEIASNTSSALTTGFTGSNFGVNIPASGDSFQISLATVCMDQPTRGAGLLVSGSTPTLVSTGSAGSVAEALDPIYEFDDALPAGSGSPTVVSNEGNMIANRDFYIEATNQTAQTSATSPFNGSSGTGHGTLALRPTTCTAGVGYWATDQGSWNQSGSGGQGQMFVCGPTNTWSLYYTPYTYPHPLDTASVSSGNSVFGAGSSINGGTIK
jgi:hypothetical protein